MGNKIWTHLFAPALTLLMLCGFSACSDDVLLSEMTAAPKQIIDGDLITTENERTWSKSVTNLQGGTGLLITPRLVLTAQHCGMTADHLFYKRDAYGKTTYTGVPGLLEHPFRPGDSPANDFLLPDIEVREIDIDSRPHAIPDFTAPYWNPRLSLNNLPIDYSAVEVAGYGETSVGVSSGGEQYIGYDCRLDRYMVSTSDASPIFDAHWFYLDCDGPNAETLAYKGDSGAPVLSYRGELLGVYNKREYLGDNEVYNRANHLAFSEDGQTQPYLDWIVAKIEELDPDWSDFYADMGLTLRNTHTDILERFAVYAEDSLDMHDRARVLDLLGDNRLSYGRSVELGVDSISNVVFAGAGGIVDADRSAVRRLIVTAGEIVPGTKVSAPEIKEYPYVTMPTLQAIKWPGPDSLPQGKYIISGETYRMSASNRNAGALLVNSGGSVAFEDCGEYNIESIILNDGATLKVRGKECGITKLNVKGRVIIRGDIEYLNDESYDGGSLLIGAWENVVIDSTVFATIVAPMGEVMVLCNQLVRGAILAKDVSIFQSAIVVPEDGGVRNWFSMQPPQTRL